MNDPAATDNRAQALHQRNAIREAAAAANPDLESIVESIWQDQAECWGQGQLVPVEDYLTLLPPSVAAKVTCDLIYGEMMLLSQRGDVDLEAYRRRFPQQSGELLRQWEFETAVAVVADASPSEVSTVTGRAPSAASSSSPLERIGKYIISSPMQDGGEADVYQAYDPELNREVVIKLLRDEVQPRSAADPRAEGRLLASLDHPGIARVYDSGVHTGRTFFVLQYLRGQTLDQFVRQRTLTQMAKLRIFERLADAVAYAHLRGVLHLDLKPRNIVVDAAGEPTIIDFGLARCLDVRRLTPQTGLRGTLQYMAPEQARGDVERVDARSDLYALGGILFFLLTASDPLPGATFSEVLARGERGEWDRDRLLASEAPRAVVRVVERAMATDPAQRYPTVKDLLAELPSTDAPFRIRRSAVVIAIGLALLAGVMVWTTSRPRPEILAGSSAVPQHAFERLLPQPIHLRVWNGNGYAELLDAVPLSPGAELRVEARVPKNCFAAVFGLGSEGAVRRLCSIDPQAEERLLTYPEEANLAVPLEGPPGTEIVLVCCSDQEPPTTDSIRSFWEDNPLAPLPGESVWRMTPQAVIPEQTARSFGPPVVREDPQSSLQRRLLELQQKLLQRNYLPFEAVAFRNPGSDEASDR